MEEKKTKKLTVDQEKFMEIVRENKLAVAENEGWLKCSAEKGRQVYISRTQHVRKVEISGFEVPSCPGVTDLKGESYGAVHQRLNFDVEGGEEVVLRTFRSIVEHMVTLPAAEKKRKRFGSPPPTVQKVVQASAGVLVPGNEVPGDPAKLLPVKQLSTEQMKVRLQLIRDEHARQLSSGDFYRKRDLERNRKAPVLAGISQAALAELGG